MKRPGPKSNANPEPVERLIDEFARLPGIGRRSAERMAFHVLINAFWAPLDFELPPISDGVRGPWRRWIDTFLDSPDDIVEWEQASAVAGRTYRAAPRSVVVLCAGLDVK